MATHGIVDIWSYPASANNVGNEVYVSLTRFLTSSYAQAIGIQRIAYNTGSSASGQNYWDQSGRVGQNAFSVYRFMSASVPFNILLQVVDSGLGLTMGSSPGNPGAVGNGTVGLGFAAAGKADGTNAWSGTTNNNGNDSKGNVVWASGSSTLYVYGRPNTGGGTYAANKQSLDQMTVVHNGSTWPNQIRCHLLCDENNFLFLQYNTTNLAYVVTYFGKYTPRSGTTAAFPYFYYRSNNGNQAPLDVISTAVFGSTAGGGAREGAIAHPSPPSSSQSTMITGLSWMDDTQAISYRPNAHVNGEPLFEEHPIHVFAYETSYYGYAGYVDWIKASWGMQSNSISSDGSRAYFGQDTRAALKLSTPWTASLGTPGYRITREGVMF